MKKFPPIIIALLIATFLAKVSLFLAMPFLSIYLMKEYHYTGMQIGVILSTSGLTSIFLSTFMGSVIDRFNKKTLIYFGLVVTILSYLCFPQIHHYGGFIAFTMISTLGASLVDPTYRVLIAQNAPQELKHLIFNVRYYLINIAAAIGPLLAGQLLFVGMQNLFYAVSFTFSINLLMFIILFRKVEVKAQETSEEHVPFFNAIYIFKRNPAFLFLVLGDIFIVFGYQQMSSTLTQYMGHIFDYSLAVKYYSYLLLVNALTVLTCQYFIYKIGRKVSTRNAMIIGSILLPLGLLMFGLSPTLIMLGIAMFIFTLGEMLIFTMWDIRIDEISEPHLKGSYYALTGLVGISSIIAPLVGGFLLDTLNQGYLIFGILAAITFTACWMFSMSSKSSTKLNNSDV